MVNKKKALSLYYTVVLNSCNKDKVKAKALFQHTLPRVQNKLSHAEKVLDEPTNNHMSSHEKTMTATRVILSLFGYHAGNKPSYL